MASINGTLTLDKAVLNNSHFSAAAADALAVDKIQQYFDPGTCFAQAIGATPATREEIIYVAKGAGTIRGFHALLNVTGSSSSMTFDLKKNGTTVLSGVATVTDADADRAVKDGTVSVPSFVAGDVLSVSLTVSSSTGAQGPFAWASLMENNTPAA